MPTVPPATETATEMQNRQRLDQLIQQQPETLTPGRVISRLRPQVLLGSGTWPQLVVPPTCIGLSGTYNSRIERLEITQACNVRGVLINNLVLAPTSTVLFEGCRFTGTIEIQAGARAAFTGCEFADIAFCDNAGAPADVLVTGTIHRNASPHVNCTVVQELVV